MTNDESRQQQNRRRWALFAGLMLVFVTRHSSIVYAISSNAGSKNGNFLKLATDARGVALGDSVVSTAEGVDALRWNPAGLATLETKEVSGTHVQYYQSVKFENVGGAYPFGDNSAAALSAFYLSAGSLDGRDANGLQTGDFTYYDLVGTAGYGRKLFTREEGFDLSAGLAVKIVQEKIAEKTYQNPALDFGLMSAPIDNLRVGLAVRNLSTSKADFAREIIGGASYTFFQDFTPAFAVNYSNDAPIRLSLSGEYRIRELDGAAVRVGYKTHDNLDNSQDSSIAALRGSDVAGLTMGAGFDYRIPSMENLKLGIDYAMAPFGALGISHTVTVKVRW